MDGPVDNRNAPRPLAVSAGDPAGIGLDIVLATYARRSALELPPFAVWGSCAALRDRARLLGLVVDVAEIASPDEATAEFFGRVLPVMPIPLAEAVVPGRPNAANGAAVIAAIEQATAAVARGEASALVTCPIAKSVLYEAGFRYPGHTEFLAALAERHVPGRSYRPVMMLAADELKVVPLTIHIALAAVPGAISSRDIVETARIMHAALASDFGCVDPRIAVAGLNPHAGEDGAMGLEDRDVIAPAIAALRAEGLAVTGPHPADTLFHAEARARYDAVLAMYHDQALIPIKTLAFDRGVNVTLGLPFVRTSPDHGTAFDIAGSGKASPASFIEALRLADRMASARTGASV